MVDTERMRKYHYNRVLIESERILDPQFDDAVVFLTGAQIEMLRNVTQYLNRLTTYVVEYNPGYYLTPTIEDFDSILEIVADMEETLMGNPNVIWGYSDPLGKAVSNLNMPAGSSDISSGVVPEGEVWRVFNAAVRSASATCTRVRVRASVDGVDVVLDEVLAPVTGQLYAFQVNVTLKEDDSFFFTYDAMTLGDDGTTYCSGYIMKV